MIIVKLIGGMGNQMFQYATGRRLELKHKTTLKLDLTFLLDRTPRENFTYRKYDLDSTFTWCGAWLNRNPKKIVIAFGKWFNDLLINTDNLIPEN